MGSRPWWNSPDADESDLLLWLHPSLETWDNLQADFFDFYGQALNKLAFDDVVTLIHLLNKVNDGLKSIHLHKEADQE